MKTIFKNILAAVIFLGLISCEQDFGQFNRDNRPEVPLTFPNATTFGFDPYIVVSNAGPGDIQFVLEIPENSGRTIREITRVSAGATALNAGSIHTAGTYVDNPIPGDGNQVVFNTTLEEFRARRPNVTSTPPAAGGFTELAFFFLVTLDNGEEIVSMRARVRVTE